MTIRVPNPIKLDEERVQIGDTVAFVDKINRMQKKLEDFSAELKPFTDDFEAALETIKLATKQQAEAGTDNVKLMTALRVAQRIDAVLNGHKLPVVLTGSQEVYPLAQNEIEIVNHDMFASYSAVVSEGAVEIQGNKLIVTTDAAAPNADAEFDLTIIQNGYSRLIKLIRKAMPEGSQSFTQAGSHVFTVPEGVYRLSAVAIGAGGYGGGNLAFANDVPVRPHQKINIQVGAAGVAQSTAQDEWVGRTGSSIIEFNGKLFLLGGFNAGEFSDVWSSSDGVKWVQGANLPKSVNGASLVAFKNKLWVIEGSTSVLCSQNGDHWSRVRQTTLLVLQKHSSVVFNNKIWIYGGYKEGNYLNEIRSSSDGVNWQQSSAPSWVGRSSFSCLVFNNKVWIMGGINSGASLLKDVWSSTDGENWIQVNSNAPWGGRRDHGSVVFKGKMWIIGGYQGSNKNDVWSSPDGVNWTQEVASAPWSPRDGHSCVVFNDKIWVISGRNSKDVWCSADGVNWTQSTFVDGDSADSIIDGVVRVYGAKENPSVPAFKALSSHPVVGFKGGRGLAHGGSSAGYDADGASGSNPSAGIGLDGLSSAGNFGKGVVPNTGASAESGAVKIIWGKDKNYPSNVN